VSKTDSEFRKKLICKDKQLILDGRVFKENFVIVWGNKEIRLKMCRMQHETVSNPKEAMGNKLRVLEMKSNAFR
jgi:hypothetical protein